MPPLELMQHIPNATSARARIRSRTYDSVGSFSWVRLQRLFRSLCPPQPPPLYLASLLRQSETACRRLGACTSKRYSQPHFRISAAGKYGATIKSYIIRQTSTTGPRIPPLYDPDIESGVLTQAGTCTLKATVTDSRGLTATKTLTLEVVDYEPPRNF